MVTDPAGKFLVTLPHGLYRYSIEKPGFGLRYGSLTVGGQGPNRITFQLDKEAIITGRLVDASGKPLAGITVSIMREQRGVSDQEGRFEIRGVGAGWHNVFIQDPFWITERRINLTLSAAEKRDLGDMVLRRAGSLTVKLLARDKSGLRPVPRAYINLSGPSYEYSHTDAAGTAKFARLSPGIYALHVYDERLQYRQMEVEIREGEQAAAEVITEMNPPSLKLSPYAQVFMPHSPVRLRLEALWIDKAEVVIYRVDQSYMRRGRFSMDRLQEVPEYALEAVKRLDVTLQPRRGSYWKARALNLGPLPPGVYVMHAAAGAASDRTSCVVTGLGLVAKAAPGETLFYAADLKTGQVIEGVEFAGFPWNPSSQAGTSTATGVAAEFRGITDGNGIARVRNPDIGLRVVGHKDDNFALLNIWAGGRGSAHEIKVHLYTDRPVYRPGQIVYFKGIMRRIAGADYLLLNAGQVRITITNPNNETVFERDYLVEKLGSFAGQFELPAEPALGTYNLIASAGSVQSHATFKVLEYRKPEYEVVLIPSKKYYLGGDRAELSLAARYYFGAPVKGAEVRYRVYSRPLYRYWSAGYDDEEMPGWYGYSSLIGEGSGVTDEDGRLSFAVDTRPVELPLSYSVEVEVTDESARKVSSSADFMVTPSLIELTVRSHTYLAAPDQPVEFSIASKTYEGQPVSARLNVEIEEQIYSPKTYTVFYKKADTITVVADQFGKVDFTYMFSSPGYWRVTATVMDERGRLAKGETWVWVWKEGYAWQSAYRQLDLELDKKSYRPGEMANLIVRNPGPGASLLVTIEGRSIYSSQVIEICNAVEVVRIPIRDSYAPRAFVSAVVVRNGRFYTRTKALKVDMEPDKLFVSIEPEKAIYRPGERARLRIKVSGTDGRPRAADLSLAVVDEAIYAIAPETAKDVYKFFVGEREHWVSTVNSFPSIYLGGAAKGGVAGGMVGGLLDKKLEEIKLRKIFKDTAFWAPFVQTDDSGQTLVEFDLPDNLTTWRATAVAQTEESEFGSARQKFIVRLDVMARLAPPRFFVAGDSLQIPGIVHNMTEEERDVGGRLETEGLAVAGEQRFSGRVAAGGTMRRDFIVRAEEPGEAMLRMRALAGDQGDALEVRVPVLPRGIKRYSQGNIALREMEGRTTIELPHQAMADGALLKIAIAPSVAASLNQSLAELIDFPYGCVEQTMSRFLPAVFARHLLGTGRWSLDGQLAEKLPLVLAQGLERLYNFQLRDGGWAWWSNGQAVSHMTAYVIYGLALARQAGVDVRADVLERGLEALRWLAEKSGLHELPYLYRSMALMGRSDQTIEQRIESGWRQLHATDKALYIRALLYLGENERARRLLDSLRPEVKREGSAAYLKDDDAYDWWYSWRWSASPVESTSLLLENVLQLEPKDPLASSLAEFLVRRRSGRWWMTTRGTATAIMALAQYVTATGELDATFTARLMLNGRELERMTIEHGKLVEGRSVITLPARELNRGANTVQLIKSSGEGALYLAAVLEYYLPPEQAGRSPGLSIERKLYRIKPRRESGKWQITYEPVEPGDRIALDEELEVRLAVENKDELRFVVIEDRLPAGFEVREAKADERFKEYRYFWDWYARSERHDERMAFFIDTLRPGRHEFRYVIYPELEGEALALPASVWPMYVPSLKSESQPWSAIVRR